MFYLIDKEKGISSFKAISNYAAENNIKKIGHTGTLDPLATGLMLVATDADTKLIEYISDHTKKYSATLILNKASNTFDVEGDVTDVEPTKKFTSKDVIKIIASYEKTYDQMPPAFSAKKVNGVRSYKLAREGKEVKLNPTTVTIHSVANIKCIDEVTYSFDVHVSKGTYIRSLIDDIGTDLGTSAIMSELDRIEVHGVSKKWIGKAIDVFELIKLPTIKIDKGELKIIFNGKPFTKITEDGTYALVFKKDIVGIAEITEGKFRTKKLFGNKVESWM